MTWELALKIATYFIAVLLGVYVARRLRKPIELVDNDTAREVREALSVSGLTKQQVSDAMIQLRKAGIIFFKVAK